MSMQHAIKIAVFGLLGFAFAPYLPLIVAMLVSGLIGTVLGKQVLTRFGGSYFEIGLNVVLTLAALRLIWSGAARLFGL
ncbi:MAG TPA: sulfite exporter TauE/SafE family protein, partial [Hyphomicrobiales bacterium]|nr:sulfite exporter TauE/SafE family protein [Hyphomicrobiales bacterium]